MSFPKSDIVPTPLRRRAEIAAGKSMSKEKTQALADAGDALAKAKEDLDLTREALASDTKFLGDLRLRSAANACKHTLCDLRCE